ncbi:calcium:proton antiporter [Pararobbsia alpina]|uniref:Sodium-potassium/proton antiporter ChaA n=1 Tax=Pararobbsia alpina TaxID=621374 RepID=A0A6S7BKV2_9BURK|nr:ionic transporter y4hA [Pararobbsia alpina]CAB3802431.1 Sodium-potassium/proton antiporter ChaA [Pararobbsia alpina]
MAIQSTDKLPLWTCVLPVLAVIMLLAKPWVEIGPVLLAFAVVLLGASVFSAVHHAEVIAHRVGEPFGTLVLAVAVTVIEVALIVSVMLTGGPEKAALARDTVFAAIMIVCNGIVGLCLLVGGIRHREQDFQIQGASAALAVLAPLSVLTLVMPNYTSSVPGPYLSSSQLLFAGAISLVLYGTFVFVQTVRHRQYFLPVATNDEEAVAKRPSARIALLSAIFLTVSLVAVVGLAKTLSPSIERVVMNMGWPDSLVGIIIAALVLLPEGTAALRSARADRLQTSLNLALGSVLASIGLTIPTVAVLFVAMQQPLVLGLDQKETVMLALTLLTSAITLGTGRTTVLQGVVHLVLFLVFLFLSIVQ